MKGLFVTWDGPGSNYHESLFLPILDRAREPGDEVHLLQYWWGAESRVESVRRAAQRLAMPYTPRRVARGPRAPVTAVMIARGASDVVRYARRNRVEVLMPRSIIPAAMALLAVRRLPGVRLLYDADGLMADERVDFGSLRRGSVQYRILRAIERAAVRRADAVITRTGRARRILASRAGLADDAKIVVVANGKDEELFRPAGPAEREATRRQLGVPDSAPLLVYAGSLGPQYLPDAMFGVAAAVRERRRDARFLVLTGAPRGADDAARRTAFEPDAMIVASVASDEVPRYLAAADLGLALRTPTFSQQAVSPIKVGEYLLCGVPVLGTAGVGDLDEQLDPDVALLLEDLDEASLRRAADWLVDDILPARERFRADCRRVGGDVFGLGRAVAGYRSAIGKVRAG